jgi:phosphoribosylcarboxyaminoimidazole (NCAIR) mutase
MAVGRAGARNAAIFAAQIIALKDRKIATVLKTYKKKMAEGVLRKARKIEKK